MGIGGKYMSMMVTMHDENRVIILIKDKLFVSYLS